ncbi:TetR/AcrR family transcriptional regulator [Winogradskya humida]|uniref:TetR family transcriptional regulator n=1 Tax=Winogradskya humida TaxID=113566 RepID=A0ABQ3ZZB9_9ACTN|nr:TetR/AcrR family transcriptional regulator [Actinoplanes humidus]GIE23946.1 TetR family transcriptional regulator [Actinoplanes humidus]
MAQNSSGRRGRPGHDVQAVLDAAVELFNERGYDATSMDDVARRLEITKSSIYHHVRGKQELLRMAIDHALDGLDDAMTQVRGLDDSTALERLETLIRLSVLVLAGRLPYVTLLLRVRGNSEVELDALTRRRAFDHEVTALVKAAQTEGGIRPDIDPATAARVLFGMVNSLAEWYSPARGNAGELATILTTVAFDGLSIRE